MRIGTHFSSFEEQGQRGPQGNLLGDTLFAVLINNVSSALPVDEDWTLCMDVFFYLFCENERAERSAPAAGENGLNAGPILLNINF